MKYWLPKRFREHLLHHPLCLEEADGAQHHEATLLKLFYKERVELMGPLKKKEKRKKEIEMGKRWRRRPGKKEEKVLLMKAVVYMHLFMTQCCGLPTSPLSSVGSESLGASPTNSLMTLCCVLRKYVRLDFWATTFPLK